MDITIVNHPLVASRLTLLRDERSDNAAFRAAANDLGAMLIYEASRDLEVEHFDTKTPVAMAEGTRLKQPPIIVPIIRAGLGMIDPALSMIPDAQVGFIGLARDEETHEPVPYLEALPQDLSNQPVFLVDPMLATGGSSCTRSAFLLIVAPPTSPPSAWFLRSQVWTHWRNLVFQFVWLPPPSTQV